VFSQCLVRPVVAPTADTGGAGVNESELAGSNPHRVANRRWEDAHHPDGRGYGEGSGSYFHSTAHPRGRCDGEIRDRR